MKKGINWKNITTKELAARVYKQLKKDGIDAVLVGGSCVTIYSDNRYVSQDLDYATHADTIDIKKSLASLGFIHRGKYYAHPDCDFLIDIVASSVAIGEEIIHDFKTMQTKYGTFKLLKVEDCVKDRLASFFYWRDRQGLEQAILICLNHKVNLKRIQTWARGESHEENFLKFKNELNKTSLQRKASQNPK